MTRSRSLLAIAALLLGARAAHAQDAPGADLPPPAPVAVDPTTPAYDAAFAALVGGDLPAAAAGFRDVAARAIDPDRVIRARELGRLADEMIAHRVRIVGGGAATAAATEAERADEDDGRTSLVALSTVYGLYTGVVIVVDGDITDFRGVIATLTATTAVGLFGSYFATDGRVITGADADAYSLGMILGAANGGLLVEPVGLSGTAGQASTSILVTSGVGALAGLGYAKAYHPTRGQVSFAGSLSLLGAASTGLGIGLVGPHTGGDSWLVAIAAGTDTGLGLGLGLGKDLDWSVSRGRLVQLGVLLGGLAGAAVGALVTGTDTSGDDTARILSGTSLAGIWAGFAIAVGATRGMHTDASFHASAPSATLAPMPVRAGGGLALVGSF